MAGLCYSGNELRGSLKAIRKTSISLPFESYDWYGNSTIHLLSVDESHDSIVFGQIYASDPNVSMICTVRNGDFGYSAVRPTEAAATAAATTITSRAYPHKDNPRLTAYFVFSTQCWSRKDKVDSGVLLFVIINVTTDCQGKRVLKNTRYNFSTIDMQYFNIVYKLIGPYTKYRMPESHNREFRPDVLEGSHLRQYPEFAVAVCIIYSCNAMFTLSNVCKMVDNDGSFRQRAVIKFLVKEEKYAAEIHLRPHRAYGDACMGASSVRRWVKLFEEGNTSIQYEPRSGRPRTASTERSKERVDEFCYAFWLKFLEPGQTINAVRYIQTVLKLRRALREKRPGKKIILPDLVTSDYQLRGERYGTLEDVRKAMNHQNLHYEKCVKSYGYTFEKSTCPKIATPGRIQYSVTSHFSSKSMTQDVLGGTERIENRNFVKYLIPLLT
ncbi:hypothetical protein ANN_23560 [Periplaneta americana]|uniref:Uncharacterized protein n=1 Tax=Periplaneta americana TaxID=6978 RepID=A0ABQ8SLV8_PERAM|nr:hypothetical protein ANN_23560 [Periplaneta americana]